VEAKPARHLPETEKMLEALKAVTSAAKPDDAAIASDDSDSTAGEENIVRHSERERLLAGRSTRRLRSHLAEATDGSGGSSFLERSQRPWPFVLWAGVAWRLVERGQRQMALFMLMCLSSYCRPSGMMGLTRDGLQPPSSGISKHWSLLLFPEGNPDVSVPLDTPYLKMLEPFYPELRRSSGKKVWTFDYPQFVREFGKCLKELGITLTITYQARLSRPSVDVARGLRDLVRVRRQGQWRTTQSVQRYEKEARLTES
jgi:hypothetical protein